MILAGLTFAIVERTVLAASTLYVDGAGVCGGNSPCFTTIQAAINAAAPGDTINVGAGTYSEQININKALTLVGPNANIDPNNGARVAEAIIHPTASDPINPGFAGPIIVTFGANGITFSGFTVDGDNPSLTSGVVFNGADVDAEFGIYGTETANPDAIINNNIVKNIGEISIWINSNTQGGAKNANSRIVTNKVDNSLGAFGQGIRISDDAWLDVTDNVVTRVRSGIVIENYTGNTTTHPASVIANNRVSAFRIGIRHNLHYVYANPGFTIRNNYVEAYAPAILPPQVLMPTAWQGIRVESIQQAVAVNVIDNTVDSNRMALGSAGYTRIDGINVTNASATSPNILFRLNLVTESIRGFYLETTAVPTLTCNTFSNNATGVVLDAAATNGLIAHSNNIAGNNVGGMTNNGPATVNAQGNWWGAANGPGPVGPGSGDLVSTNVDFSGWLTTPSDCPPICPTNVALASYGATATASSEFGPSYSVGGIIDGEKDGNMWGSNGGWNDGTFGTFPDDATVNLNVVQSVNEIFVYTLKDAPNDGSIVTDGTTFSSYGIANFEVQSWNGSSWVTVPDGVVKGNNRVKKRFSFATPIVTDRIRVVVNGSADDVYSRIIEVGVYSCSPVAVPTPSPSPTPTPSPCGSNVALAANGSSVTASSQFSGSYSASSVIDGEVNGNMWGSNGGWNDSTFGTFPDDITVMLYAVQPISEIDVYTLKDDPNSGSIVTESTTFSNYGITNFVVQYWNGTAFVPVPGGTVAGNNKVRRRFIFGSPVVTDRIRVVVNGSADNGYSRIIEIEAYNCAPVMVNCVNPGGTGGCFSTIQAAINASNPGDVINVASGTYNENLTLGKSLILRGAQNGVSACGRSAPESIVTASGTLLTLSSGSAGAVIDGFTFSGGAIGIASSSGPINNLQLLNNRILGFTGNGIFLNDTGADITIHQNSVDGTSKTGGGGLVHLDTDLFNGFRLTNNCISNGFASATGFFVDGNRNVGTSAARASLVGGNVFNNIQTGANIGTRALDNATISGNTFSNCAFDGLQGGPRNTTITGNIFSGNGRSGLALTSFGNMGADRGAQNCTVTCNTMTGNGFTQNSAGMAGGGITFSATQAPGTISTNHANQNYIAGNFVGARYTGTETIDAENNWWGATNGPSGAYPGGGDAVTSINIDAMPFLTSDPACAPIPPSPPAPCPTNVALATNGSTATASSTFNASYTAASAIDGERDGNMWGSNGGWNDATFGAFPDNLQVNFAVSQPISEIDVYTLKNDFNSGSIVTDSTAFTMYGITAFNVQYWNGSSWIDVPGGGVTGNNRVKRQFIFASPITTDRIRVVVNDSADDQFSRIIELEAYSCAPVIVRCVNNGGSGGCFGTIQAAINASSPGDVVIVQPGTYDEDVNVNKAGLQLLSSGGTGSTNIRGPIGGPGATVQVTASNVTVAGFTITRLGNNTTDWNNPGLNSVGVAVQGQAITGMLIRDNVITGNRSGLDINNSNGHTVRNNVIDFNRTGIIYGNQTDNQTVVENFITNNWTVGILFLDRSGAGVPPQSALHSTFSNNNLSANWYGQIVDRQSGGTLPAPGTTNYKNFRGNWYGTTSPVITTANSAEPGYAAQIPVAYGGAAAPPGGQPDIAGPASANFQIEPILTSGTDTNVETTPGRGTFGFQGVANTVLVSPSNQNGWVFFDDFPGMGTGSGGFEAGPATPPLGAGSAFLTVDANGRHAFATFSFVGTRMDDLTALVYGSYQDNNANTVVAPSLQFDIDYDLNDAATAYQGRLAFEPYLTGTVQQNVWQSWDARVGNWYGTRTTVTVNNVAGVTQPCQPATPCTYQQVLALFPNAGVRNAAGSAVLFKVGGPWSPGFDGNVDGFTIKVGGAVIGYNFEHTP
jgi:hypothetical protein